MDILKGVIVGSDEALKGDTFGGIVVAAVRASPTEREALRALGVKDSKRLSDNRINELAAEIMSNFKWHAEVLTPRQYNKEIEKGKLTLLLNKLHSLCNSKLKTQNSKHVVDLYPGCMVGDLAIPRAESEFVEVAAASIIARHLALKQIQQLSKQAGFTLPLGSTHVAHALARLKKHELEQLAKLHFKNVQKIYK